MHLDPEQHQMTAIVLAGDRTKADSLINHSKAGSKAMIDIDGTAHGAQGAEFPARLPGGQQDMPGGPEASEVATDEPLAKWVEDGEVIWSEPGVSPSTSAYQAMRALDPEEAVLLTTADHPLLTPEIVDAFGRQSLADDVDVAVGLAPHALVLEAYPGIKKTVLHFSDGDFCGCNLFAFITPEGRRAARFWRKIEQQRKKPLVVIGLLGWWAVIRYRLGLLSLEEALAKLSKRLGLRMRAVILPYANAAIDVDSIADLMLVKGSLAKAAAEDA